MEYSIQDYLKYYKDYDFNEEPFNDVDNVLLSLISYVNLSKIFKNKTHVTIKEASDLFWSSTTEKEVNEEIRAVRKASYLIREMAKTKRFKNLKLYNYQYIVDSETQFGAVTIDLLNNMIYVSYRGTDNYVVGWKEDFQMSYIFPVKAQRLAIKYMNSTFKFRNHKIIVGGHSKGGNLALVASMYCKHYIKKRITKVYSNDGLGLRQKEFNSSEYKKIIPKFKHIIPRNSLVGILLNHDDKYYITDSSARGLLQHDATTWRCYGSHFIKADLTKATKKRETSLYKWLDNYDDVHKEKIVESFFSIFAINNITDLKELKISNFLQIIKSISNLRNVDAQTRKIIIDTIKDLYSQFRNSKSEQ